MSHSVTKPIAWSISIESYSVDILTLVFVHQCAKWFGFKGIAKYYLDGKSRLDDPVRCGCTVAIRQQEWEQWYMLHALQRRMEEDRF